MYGRSQFRARMLSMVLLAAAIEEDIKGGERFMWNKEHRAMVIIPPARRLPKGCKEYFFNESGEFSTSKMAKSECVFTCIASNEKNARRKFNNRQKL